MSRKARRLKAKGSGKETEAAAGQFVEVGAGAEHRPGRAVESCSGSPCSYQRAPELAIRKRARRASGEGHRVGVGRADEDIDLDAEARQFAGQEPEVNPLASALHVAAIRDEGDPRRGRAMAQRREPRVFGFSARRGSRSWDRCS